MPPVCPLPSVSSKEQLAGDLQNFQSGGDGDILPSCLSFISANFPSSVLVVLYSPFPKLCLVVAGRRGNQATENEESHMAR